MRVYFIISAVLIVFNCVLCILLLPKYLHILQLKNYKTKQYYKWLSEHKKTLKNLQQLVMASGISFIVNLINSFTIQNLIISLIYLPVYLCVAIKTLMGWSKTKKVEFKITARIKRIFVSHLLVILFVHIVLIVLTYFLPFLHFFYLPLIVAFSPHLLATANVMELPLEIVLQNKFFKASKQKLRSNQNLITIAITGSVGKTSTKEILYHLLKDDFNVIKSPMSYNTPLGICKTINDLLTDKTEIFIAEMGAKQKNDIKLLCQYIKPRYGIVTFVGGQHLQTFKSLENIFDTKKELPDFLKQNLCVYNIDNAYVKKMHMQKSGQKIAISVSQEADIFAKNIKIQNGKTEFDLCYDNTTYGCKTELLGEHNVVNILLGAALALQFLTMPQIVEKIESLPQVNHRLQLLQNDNAVNILDDSYNCSADSAQAALKVLAEIGNQKIVCTPGIIEGGKQQFEQNYKLATQIAKVADKIIIVGKTNKAAFEKAFCELKVEDKVFYADSLETAKKLFAKWLKPHDSLLLLNDLPDDYC